jgi:hypothetical protein
LLADEIGILNLYDFDEVLNFERRAFFHCRVGVVTDPPLQESVTDPQILLDALVEPDDQTVAVHNHTEVCRMGSRFSSDGRRLVWLRSRHGWLMDYPLTMSKKIFPSHP